MSPELRAWLDRLLSVVDGLADDVRYVAEKVGHRDGDGVRLTADTASRELVDLQRTLYQLPTEELS